jgi:DnaJ-class molecular chaperone
VEKKKIYDQYGEEGLKGVPADADTSGASAGPGMGPGGRTFHFSSGPGTQSFVFSSSNPNDIFR